MEQIFLSAVLKDGIIYAGLRHNNCIHHITERGKHYKPSDPQGFLTTTGRFVDRIEGLAIATAAGQLIRKTNPQDILFSEDLW